MHLLNVLVLLPSAILATTRKASIVYVTLSNTPAASLSGSRSIVYVTLGTPSIPGVPSASSASSISSVPNIPGVAPSITGRYTVETYTFAYETGVTVTDDASTAALPDAGSDTDPGSVSTTMPDNAGITVTVTQNVTITASDTNTPSSTSIYIPQTHTSSHRHRFWPFA